jgi:hypothetical protein
MKSTTFGTKIVGTKIGNVINLVIDGNAFQKTFQSQDEANAFYRLMHEARNGDKTALENLMTELNRRYRTVIKGILEKDGDDNYFYKGIDIKMPKLLADTFVDYLENEFPVTALVNFWKLLVSNPDARVRQDLFEFLQHYNFSITDNGYFIAYKAVEVKQAAELDIAAFVSNQYLKIKKWKKNVLNYNVVVVEEEIMETKEVEKQVPNPDYEVTEEWNEDEEEYVEDDNGEPEYITETVKETVTVTKKDLKLVPVGEETESEVIGILGDLFKNIDQLVNNRTIYQSKHSGVNGKIEQVLGVPVKQERGLCNRDPKIECSAGLHVGSVRYVENFANPSDKILLALVNPAHVVAVPDYDNSKMRTCEYFPYAELERLENNKFEIVEQPYFEEDYMKYEATELEKEIERIQSEIEGANNPTKEQLDYKKILQDRLMTIEEALAV